MFFLNYLDIKCQIIICDNANQIEEFFKYLENNFFGSVSKTKHLPPKYKIQFWNDHKRSLNMVPRTFQFRRLA